MWHVLEQTPEAKFFFSIFFFPILFGFFIIMLSIEIHTPTNFPRKVRLGFGIHVFVASAY